MLMKNIIFSLWVLAFAPMSAQSLFTEHIKSVSRSDGRIMLHHADERITRLVNSLNGQAVTAGVGNVKHESGKRDSVREHNETRRILNVDADSLTVKKAHRYKKTGYRIQIYAGGNSRKARIEAEQIGATCKSYYPELAVYTHFSSPRWVCRVGDFKTLSEANRYMQIFAKAKKFGEASIVKCQIFVFY